MRPLIHPSIENVTVEGILHALSDPVRVAIFSHIAGSDCSQNCSAFLEVSEKTIPKSTLSQHFKALREAGLIRSERQGVEMQNTSRCAEMQKRFPGLILAIITAHQIQSGRKTKAGGKRKSAARSRKR
jgi:DNA-binding transcriptional ArsR family regulator